MYVCIYIYIVPILPMDDRTNTYFIIFELSDKEKITKITKIERSQKT